MSTEFTLECGMILGVRSSQGVGMSPKFQCELTKEQYDQLDEETTLVCRDDSIEECTLASLVNGGELFRCDWRWMTPFVMNRRAIQAKQMATKYSESPALAHKFAVAGQELSDKARNL